MTLDEAIKRCEEEAEKYMEYGIETECYQCGKEYEQLAEWLRELKALRAAAEHETDLVDEYEAELKEAKRLLNEAVLAFRIMGEDIDCHFNYLCEKCPLNNNNDWCEWKYQAEALKLLNEEI